MEGYLELITPVYENDELNQSIKTGEKVDSVWLKKYLLHGVSSIMPVIAGIKHS